MAPHDPECLGTEAIKLTSINELWICTTKTYEHGVYMSSEFVKRTAVLAGYSMCYLFDCEQKRRK